MIRRPAGSRPLEHRRSSGLSRSGSRARPTSLYASAPAHRAVTTAAFRPSSPWKIPRMRSENIPPRLAVRTLDAALSTLLVASAAPYGYTLAVWSSGALLMRPHGVPDPRDVFIFVAGAIAGFNLLGLWVEEGIKRTMPIERRGDRLIAGVLDWVAVGAVVGAVSLLAEIHGWVPWLLAPLVATVLYLLLASLQLAALALRHDRGRNDGPANRGGDC
jgi:hypothetical protein